MPLYRPDLAWIHHEGYSDFARDATPFVLRLLAERKGLVIDVGCGSGVLAHELTRAGFEVLGYDASPAMIELARQTAPAAGFAVATFEAAGLPRCAAILAVGEVLNYGDARAFLPRAAQALEPGGLLLFDVAERDASPPYREHRSGGDDWSVIATDQSDGRTLTRRIRTFRNVDGETRRDDETHTLELYDRAELLARLRPYFRVTVRRSYGSARLPKGHAVYVATRRGSHSRS